MDNIAKLNSDNSWNKVNVFYALSKAVFITS